MPANTTASARGDGRKTAAKTASAAVGAPPNPPSLARAEGRPVTHPATQDAGQFLKNADASALIQRMAAGGHNLNAIAAALGTSRRSLGRAFEAQPELRDAFDDGRAMLEQELASLLLEKARAGNVTCAIFLLKPQCGWRDSGSEAAGGPAVAVQINLPAALSAADYARQFEGPADA